MNNLQKISDDDFRNMIKKCKKDENCNKCPFDKCIRDQKLLSMLEEIEKKNYDATTKAITQIMAIREVWKDLDIDWMELLDKIKKKKSTNIT